ncbi:acyl-CoA dehydrogenase domain protein [Acidovorax delafieldii 2AN]|uniref:Acyl-CoA dehydrogenase domain protein n=1 Tax=Acidovorax delafieldii 2AN TaxID=573060 RepID=C5T159_ACIDE|nr:acyl-CoA dehydrogenase family protein [Acidovorax delafieldii]EER61803.1 acyl-CoA dehydrogenase domain protein [Acidovorax delafieldii 2AN]
MSEAPNLTKHLQGAAGAAREFLGEAKRVVSQRCAPSGRAEAALLQQHQRALHGLAWIATTVEAIACAASWSERLAARGQLNAGEELVLTIGVGEYLAQLTHGIPMSQSEIFRPVELGLERAAEALAGQASARWLISRAAAPETRRALVDHFRSGGGVTETAFDEDLDVIRDQFRRFADKEITPKAHAWHLADELIPDDVVGQLSELGVFGVSISGDYGGMGLGKRAMCIVTEELSRAWIAAGSLGTRSEIAAELIGCGGTAAQKSEWLPKIASGEVLPTAVFTEPDTGSDLGALRTRATQVTGGGWRIDGNKTWITHASRSDLMTLLTRTEPGSTDHNGLSMFLAPKPRGTKAQPFPASGMSGGEIPVLGYRGMKEYDLAFDGFEVGAEGLLGGVRGQGFRQLMQTFEGARIQTAARAVGVAWRAFDLAWRYANDRKQFGAPIIEFPRVADKLALMIAETVLVRELSHFAAEEKDRGIRCDVEAGMAKLLAARVAWSNADNGLQIHGGNGYALEFEISRVLCDARILNIFEGAAEIQAQVIGRGLLAGSR